MFDVGRFVEDCRAAVHEAQPSIAIKELLDRAMSDPRQLMLALGEPSASDIGLIYAGADVTVLHAVWAPCMSLYPHNHNMPAVIGIYGGAEDNTFWTREERGLRKAGGRMLRERDVCVLGPDVIHSVENPQRAYTAAVHVYLGDYLHEERSEWDPVTFEERPFNLENSKRVFAEADARWKRLNRSAPG